MAGPGGKGGGFGSLPGELFDRMVKEYTTSTTIADADKIATLAALVAAEHAAAKQDGDYYWLDLAVLVLHLQEQFELVRTGTAAEQAAAQPIVIQDLVKLAAFWNS